MPREIAAAALAKLLDEGSPLALIDVREHGEYNLAHIAGSSSVPRRQFEARMGRLVPYRGVPVVVCDDNGRRAALAAATLERMGYRQVSVLKGGVNRWASEDLPTEWGMNVPSKDFGEKVEVVNHVPTIGADELAERQRRGDELIILDTRTPEEYRRFCIPGGRSAPGGELALRITDLVSARPNATIVINCAGRTRSIIGARVLQRMKLPNVVSLRNGTSGWLLAGLELERGADRVELPSPSPQGLAAAEGYADRLAAEDGVRNATVAELQKLMPRAADETVYLVDVRTRAEYLAGHIPGFGWMPGGQAVQRSDDTVAVRTGTIVFAATDACAPVRRPRGTGRWVSPTSSSSPAGRRRGRRPGSRWCRARTRRRSRWWPRRGRACVSSRRPESRPRWPRRVRRGCSAWSRAIGSPPGTSPARTGCRAAGSSSASPSSRPTPPLPSWSPTRTATTRCWPRRR